MQKKVLIIEDDQFSAATYKHHFDKANYVTQIAHDGRQALDQVDTFKPNIIILDLIVPKIDGFTLLHFIKKIPTIIVSNLDQKDDIDKCLKQGAKLFVSKDTVNYTQLLKETETLLK